MFARIRQFMTLPVLMYFVLSSYVCAAEQSTGAYWQLINYWSEWCAPCRKEIPMLNALSLELAASEIRLAGVNFDDDPRDVTLDIAARLGIGFYTLTKPEVRTLNLEAPDAMPTTYLVSPLGETVLTLIGLQTREQILEQLARLGLLTDAS